MTTLGWNLVFNGQCEEAFRFYEKCLGGRINIMMTWGESPMAKDVPNDWATKITHASLIVGNQELTGGDLPSSQFEKPQGFSVILNMTDIGEAARVFNQLSAAGKIKTPFQETFWASGFGMVTDQFGIPWMINCGKPAGS